MNSNIDFLAKRLTKSDIKKRLKKVHVLSQVTYAQHTMSIQKLL